MGQSSKPPEMETQKQGGESRGTSSEDAEGLDPPFVPEQSNELLSVHSKGEEGKGADDQKEGLLLPDLPYNPCLDTESDPKKPDQKKRNGHLRVVKGLERILKTQDACSIALVGSFGSGKSSIIRGLSYTVGGQEVGEETDVEPSNSLGVRSRIENWFQQPTSRKNRPSRQSRGSKTDSTTSSSDREFAFLTYDAWVSRDQSAKRGFVQELCRILDEKKWGDKEKRDRLKEKLLKQQSRDSQRTDVRLTYVALLIVLSFPFVSSIFSNGLTRGIAEWLSPIFGSWSSEIMLLSVLLVLIMGLFIDQSISNNDEGWRIGGDETEKSLWQRFLAILPRIPLVKHNIRTEGEQTTDPVKPTSTRFRDTFAQVTKDGLRTEGASQRHLVIVVENMDRLAPAEAKELWATLQTFFNVRTESRTDSKSKEGGSHWTDCLWLLVPLSPSSLDDIRFGTIIEGESHGHPVRPPATVLHAREPAQSGDGATEESQPDAAESQQGSSVLLSKKSLSLTMDFLEKTFQLTVHVPSPVLTEARVYFERNARRVFPSEYRQHSLLYSTFRVWESQPSMRRVKRFLNDLFMLREQLSLEELYDRREGGSSSQDVIGDSGSASESSVGHPAAAYTESMKRQWLAVYGGYLLFRRYLNRGVEKELLEQKTERYRSFFYLLDVEPDEVWRLWGALYYCVPVDDVAHMLLQARIESALLADDAIGLFTSVIQPTVGSGKRLADRVRDVYSVIHDIGLRSKPHKNGAISTFDFDRKTEGPKVLSALCQFELLVMNELGDEIERDEFSQDTWTFIYNKVSGRRQAINATQAEGVDWRGAGTEERAAMIGLALTFSRKQKASGAPHYSLKTGDLMKKVFEDLARQCAEVVEKTDSTSPDQERLWGWLHALALSAYLNLKANESDRSQHERAVFVSRFRKYDLHQFLDQIVSSEVRKYTISADDLKKAGIESVLSPWKLFSSPKLRKVVFVLGFIPRDTGQLPLYLQALEDKNLRKKRWVFLSAIVAHSLITPALYREDLMLNDEVIEQIVRWAHKKFQAENGVTPNRGFYAAVVIAVWCSRESNHKTIAYEKGIRDLKIDFEAMGANEVESAPVFENWLRKCDGFTSDSGLGPANGTSEALQTLVSDFKREIDESEGDS